MGDISRRRWIGRGLGLRIRLEVGLWSLDFTCGVDVVGYTMDFPRLIPLIWSC